VEEKEAAEADVRVRQRWRARGKTHMDERSQRREHSGMQVGLGEGGDGVFQYHPQVANHLQRCGAPREQKG
jgi:hypothetical protein